MENIGRSFTELWANFRDAIHNHTPTIAPGAAGQRALEIALGAYLSGATGQVVTVPLATNHPVYLEGIDGIAKSDVWAESRTKAAGLFGLWG